PPITDIFGFIKATYPSRRVLLTTQVYEKLNPTSLCDVQALLDWSDLRIYDLDGAGKNHGILLGTSGWKPKLSTARTVRGNRLDFDNRARARSSTTSRACRPINGARISFIPV